MKAALQNLVLYLLCVASVVLAAPNHSTLFPQPLKNNGSGIFSKPTCVKERPYFTQQKTAQPLKTSVLEGTARFQLW